MGKGRQKGGRCRCGGAPTCIVCKIPLLARRTRPKGQRPSARATIGYLVYNNMQRYATGITVLLLVSLDESACRVERLFVQMTIVLLRLCCSVVVTSFMAVTSAWNTEQKSGSLKDE